MGFSQNHGPPDQVEIVNETFTPSAAEIDRARSLVAAFSESESTGKSSFVFDGEMVDAPHLARALRLLARAGVADDR